MYQLSITVKQTITKCSNLKQHSFYYDICGPGIWEKLSWVVLAQDLLYCCSYTVAGDGVTENYMGIIVSSCGLRAWVVWASIQLVDLPETGYTRIKVYPIFIKLVHPPSTPTTPLGKQRPFHY